MADLVDAEGLRSALARSLAGEVRFDRLSRALYSTDASIYQIIPLGVVIPRSEADVVETVKACARFGVPITARGGGTSQAGQAIGAGVVLDCSKYLNRVLEINAAERWVRVQPGCVLDELNLELEPHGLQFAPDISTSDRATIGGMIGNNSAGARSILHGKTIDHVLELKVVLSDGSVIDAKPLGEEDLEARCRQEDLEGRCTRAVRRLASEHAGEIERRYPRVMRRVGGYNLDAVPGSEKPRTFNPAHLFVGSEGTLGMTLEARLRLVDLPRAKAVIVLQFSDLMEALGANAKILPHGPAAIELLDKYVLDSTRLNPEAAKLRGFLHEDTEAILLVEFYGEHPEELPPRLEALEGDLRRRGFAFRSTRAVESEAQARLWKLRRMALGLCMAQKGDAKAISFVEDTAVAPERLRDYIAEFLEIIARHGTRAGVYAHASVGCLHVRPVVNLKTEEGLNRFQAIASDVADLVLRYGGALSGEHGDGLLRSPFQEKMYGPALYRAFCELKDTFDPKNLFNPGKIVRAPPLASNLRTGPTTAPPDVPATFDFSADGGLVPATEMCVGVGACRKKRGGSMCPSYRATRDERDSTRGRADALRLAMTGQLGFTGLTDPALFDVLDLCLECKACKSECPTNVDMARFKAEFLHQYYRANGLPRRNRIFGRVARVARWGCRLAPVSNWLVRNLFSRWLNEKLLGIDRRRVPPLFARRRFTKRAQAGDGSGVLLFPDTFVEHFEPEVGLAAVELLRRAGSGVRVGSPADLRCCGRPMISNGLLDEAVECARVNVERLHPWAAEGTVITACEPSCVLTLKDDYPALLRGEDRRKAETVAAACRTFEECLDGSPGVSSLRFRAGPTKILVQGHCHQRSLTGMDATLHLLGRIPGTQVMDLDAGCCGMAGSFGYESEHYEVSRLVGEQKLFPALRESGREEAVVAPGFSCRLQIRHFTDRTAMHPASFLWSLLERAT